MKELNSFNIYVCALHPGIKICTDTFYVLIVEVVLCLIYQPKFGFKVQTLVTEVTVMLGIV